MATSDSNQALLDAVGALIEKWCDRRCLKALHRILGAYLAFNGLTDGWGELGIALQDVRALARTELTDEELAQVDALIQKIDRLLRRA